MGKSLFRAALQAAAILALACEPVDHYEEAGDGELPYVSLEEVAGLLSALPLDAGHLVEVHDAVTSSSVNGYDEEYMMRDLFRDPGSGVGDAATRALGRNVATRSYVNPLRDVIGDYVREQAATKAGAPDPEIFLKALESSDIQIYWPYFDDWNGDEYPIITFDPGDGSDANTGWRIKVGPDGRKTVEEVIVDEEDAMRHPVWVVNRNDDSEYNSLEMLRRRDPDWGKEGGGEIIIGGGSSTKAPSGTIRTLILKDFTMKRNYDPWFAGGSEFFCKIGAVEDFTATTEEEMLQYTPYVTDFMIVVKRWEVDKKRPFNAVLVSKWTDQLESCGFLIVEDDGGTQDNWKCTAEVKVKSKSYGMEINIPLHTRDDIVWRGQLAASYFERYSGQTGHFGDVDLTFELVEM